MNKKELLVFKKWKNAEPGEPLTWFKTTLNDCLEHTEGAGFWREGTVEQMLREGHEVWNPFAHYKGVIK